MAIFALKKKMYQRQWGMQRKKKKVWSKCCPTDLSRV